MQNQFAESIDIPTIVACPIITDENVTRTCTKRATGETQVWDWVRPSLRTLLFEIDMAAN